MTAFDVITAIADNENLQDDSLRFCFVNQDKVPYNGLCPARPNNIEDFVPIYMLNLGQSTKFAGLGLSIQASKICAIDVDHCFEKPFEVASADSRAQEIINLFGDHTYIEFSFSGTGLRLFFKANPIPDYSKHYYIKNSKRQIEYYYPEGSNRYVTITAKQIINKPINYVSRELLQKFLDTYMLRPQKLNTGNSGAPAIDNIDAALLHFLRSDKSFQDNWFDKAPGSGSNESERDFFLIKFIFDNITQNKDQIKELFERSPFFKSKDRKHKYKWEKSENRYFNYLFSVINGGN